MPSVRRVQCCCHESVWQMPHRMVSTHLRTKESNNALKNLEKFQTRFVYHQLLSSLTHCANFCWITLIRNFIVSRRFEPWQSNHWKSVKVRVITRCPLPGAVRIVSCEAASATTMLQIRMAQRPRRAVGSGSQGRLASRGRHSHESASRARCGHELRAQTAEREKAKCKSRTISDLTHHHSNLPTTATATATAAASAAASSTLSARRSTASARA
jgi:hypothetical protein